MKLAEVFAFEVGMQRRRFITWLYFALLVFLGFYMTRELYIDNATSDGFFYNSAFVSAAMTVLCSGVLLLAATAVAGDAGARDVQTLMHPILYTTPVSPATYLWGRFLASFATCAVIALGIPLGLLLSSYLPGAQAELVGPFRPSAYILPYLFIALPTGFVAAALLFTVTLLTRRAASAYLVAVVLFFLAVAGRIIIAVKLGHWDLAKLLDPLGLTIVTEMSKAWTAAEKNTRSITTSWLLANRALWIVIAVVTLAGAQLRFRFKHLSVGSLFERFTRGTTEEATPAAITVPRVRGEFTAATRLHQLRTIAFDSFRMIVLGWGGVALAFLSLILVLTGRVMAQHMGVPLQPVTAHVTRFIGGSGELLWMVIPLMIAFYAGELVWRERDARMRDITDATAVPDWVSITGKFTGLALVLTALQLLLIAAAVAVQTMLGYTHYELGLYAKILLGLQLIDYLLFALLAFAAHVVINQKYVAHLFVVAAYVFMNAGPALGMEHHLLVFGSAPEWRYSDMSGFDGSVRPWLFFKLYWAAWAILHALAIRLLWVRGTEHDLRSRMRLAVQRINQRLAYSAAIAGILILTTGGFVFYNTNVLNTYRTPAQLDARAAAYDTLAKQLEHMAQPSVVAVDLNVDLRPHMRSADVRGRYTLVNKTDQPIDAVHVTSRGRVRVYRIPNGLQPGDALAFDFTTHIAQRGFSNDGVRNVVRRNGTFLPHSLLPRIGYRSRDVDDAELVTVNTIVSTDSSQIAVAVGTLRRSWMKDGKRYFHYQTDRPIRHEYAVFSANYAVRDTTIGNVDYEVLYEAKHPWNVGRMLEAMQKSVGYYSTQFGPYPYRQLRLIERPGFDNSLHASPINMFYFEGFALFKSEADKRDVDFPFAVTAHEVAHQWWGNQLIRAVDSSPLLTEGLAWYSALCLVEREYGTAHMERLLDMFRAVYITPHERAARPLLTAAADGYQTYRKGPFAMYALREYVGKEKLNGALRRLLHRSTATSIDLYRELQDITPDSIQPLLADLFERNTFWELETRNVRVEPAGNQWRVALDVVARKIVVDTIGAEREVPMNDLIEVGDPLHPIRMRIHSGAQRIELIMANKPKRAGIDPRHLLIDDEPKNNVLEVN